MHVASLGSENDNTHTHTPSSLVSPIRCQPHPPRQVITPIKYSRMWLPFTSRRTICLPSIDLDVDAYIDNVVDFDFADGTAVASIPSPGIENNEILTGNLDHRYPRHLR